MVFGEAVSWPGLASSQKGHKLEKLHVLATPNLMSERD
jgi:hypothetical protein